MTLVSDITRHIGGCWEEVYEFVVDVREITFLYITLFASDIGLGLGSAYDFVHKKILQVVEVYIRIYCFYNLTSRRCGKHCSRNAFF